MDYRERSRRLQQKTRNRNRKIMAAIIVAVMCITVIIIFIIYRNNPYNRIMKAVTNYNAEVVISIYEKDIKENKNLDKKVKEQLENELKDIVKDFNSKEKNYNDAVKTVQFLIDTNIISEDAASVKQQITTAYQKEQTNKTEKAYEDFKAGTITYDDAKAVLKEISGENIIPEQCIDVSERLDKLNVSKESYKEGSTLAETKKYTEAVVKFKAVIEEDPDYKDAQVQIKELRLQYKKELLDEVEKLAKEEKYEDIITKLENGLTILKKDKDFTSSLKQYRKKNIEKLKSDQWLKVSKPEILIQHPTKKKEYPDMLSAIVTNDTKKTLTYYEIAFMAFDKSGNTLQIRYYPSGKKNNYVVVGMMEKLNIAPGKTYGKGYGWEMYERKDIKEIKACVIRAEFKDGTKWENPFYNYWKETYLPKE